MSMHIKLTVSVLAFGLVASGTACRKAKRADEKTKSLETLGYLSSAPVSDSETALEGVTVLEPESVAPGITIACLLRAGDCLLVDTAGNVVHRLKTTAPESAMAAGFRKSGEGPYVVRDYDATSLAILNGPAIQRIDLAGNVLMNVDAGDDVRFHHDLAVRDDKAIVAIYGGERWIEHKGTKLPIFDDGLMLIRPDGKLEKLVSFWDVLQSRILPEKLEALATTFKAGKLEKSGPTTRNAKFASVDSEADLFHANSVVIAPRDAARWSKGDYILCIRQLGKAGGIYVLDQKTFALKWSYEGDVDHPHDPEVLPNGNVMLFDNGMMRDWSRVIEIDPSKDAIVREYRSSKPLFLTHEAGGAQPLSNGNWLITEMERGHLFEINPAGKVVWEYWSPVSKMDADGRTKLFRDLIYRARRVDAGTPSSVTDLQKLVEKAASPGAPLTAIHKTAPDHSQGRAWPVGVDNNPRMSFVFSESASGITYRATSGPVPAGEYRVTISNARCAPDVTVADFGTFTSTGATAEWSFEGKLVGKPPEGGLGAMLDRLYVAVIPKDASKPLACGRLFAM